MIAVSERVHTRILGQITAMEQERQPWLALWKRIADNILPRRYMWLEGQQSAERATTLHNPNIYDGTPTVAARTLAAGMMNGITSPARPWFRLRAPSLAEESTEVRIFLDEVARRMLQVMGETNFYNAFAVMYLDLSTFATAALIIYEDEESVFRCYNLAAGEYCLQQNHRKIVDSLSRKFTWRAKQIVDEFGYENCTRMVQEAYNRPNGGANTKFEVYHIIEPADKNEPRVAPIMKYREIYFEKGRTDGQLLRVKGFREWPGVTPRWETLGNDSYGTGPTMDALGDVEQLQHLTKRLEQGIDKLVSPPMLATLDMANRETALLPNGITYVQNLNENGARPAYQVNIPVAELAALIRSVQERVRIFYHNDLFRMISQLDTVRSATEIDARREEKLIELGPVLERIENEALDAAITRIFSIMLRKGMFPEIPAALQDENIEVQYVSILSDAQRAVGAIPIERYTAFLGNIAAARPEMLEIPNWTELAYEYAERLGVPMKTLRDKAEVLESIEALKKQQQLEQTAQVAAPLAQASKALSETEVGGGANALQQLMG
jgi:hypothetical protein